MSKMLVVNAHPKVTSETSVSLQILHHFMDEYRKLNPSEEIEQVDLYSDEIPVIDQVVLGAWDKLAQQQPLTSEEQRITGRMSQILQQFKSASTYVIAFPLYNFNVPSKLKDYMDNVLIARETFKYTENGSVGLLNDGRSILVIQGSGAVYTNNDWYTEVEYSHKYLKSMFNFLGVDDYQIIRAQGTSVSDRSAVLSAAKKEAEEAAVRLAHVVTK